MNKDDSVSIEWVINKLALSELPKSSVYQAIVDGILSGDLDMYFDVPIVGTDDEHDVELVLDENENVTGGLIGNGYSYQHTGMKLATGVDVYFLDGKFKFAVNAYYYEEKRYFPTDGDGEWHRPKFIDVDLVYFDKNQVVSYASSDRTAVRKGEQGLLKALALLAREMADNHGAKYKTGDKVNASAFKEHVLSLAEEYEISDGLLNSLDEKVSKALKNYELKEIPPNKK